MEELTAPLARTEFRARDHIEPRLFRHLREVLEIAGFPAQQMARIAGQTMKSFSLRDLAGKIRSHFCIGVGAGAGSSVQPAGEPRTQNTRRLSERVTGIA